MQKGWFIVDVHNHYLPEEVIVRAGNSDGMNVAISAKKRSQAYQHIRDAESTLRIMDETGINVTVLSIAQWSSLGIEDSRIINNNYSEIIKKYPGRFVGCANIPLESDSGTIYELERAIKELGLTAVSLVTSTPRLALGSEQLEPLFSKINHLNIPVIIHPSIRSPLWGGTEYNMSYHISREYEIAKATVEVLYGWLAKYPNIRFMMPHFGGGMPSLKGRIAAWFEPEGWEIPANIKNGGKTPRELKELGLDKAFEEIFGKLYFDMAGFAGWMPIVQAALMTIRADRLCFGTDYPLDFHGKDDIKAYIENIHKLNISDSDKVSILGGNAREFFGIEC